MACFPGPGEDVNRHEGPYDGRPLLFARSAGTWEKAGRAKLGGAPRDKNLSRLG
jgi:hypothetical protein